ncbi:MmgE/PrpD family protein [Actinobacillus indolicus]|uniref:MmgE/PrpD family protein n=1 Tax=Actinobacillus indolicus TaxID=51049 RepID=A0A4P7CE14_9PAST|nr:MmgE/PrpD family protein [Actinobacillus indolicus]QBQ63056.1 MmgE/PrpD family protein [Actinobacillus indolicus]
MSMKSQQFSKLIMDTPLIVDDVVLDYAINGVIDYFASSLPATNQHDIEQLKKAILQEQGIQTSWLIGHKVYVTSKQAALCNGFQAHLLDNDDVHELVRGHPSAVILSALFASIDITQHQFIDSRRFLTAYIIGVEVMACLGKAVNPTLYLKGWHATATLGGIASVAAICYLHQYPFLEQAFMLAATQASGLRLVFGSSVKALHAGIAAQQAIQSIEWLKLGLNVTGDFLDQAVGFLTIFANSEAILDLSNWGQKWQISELWFKNYSYCSAASSIADATDSLVSSHTLDLAQIQYIKVTINPNADSALIYKYPQTSLQGRFSAEYIVAKILAKESLSFDAFNTELIHSDTVQLMQKITREYIEDKVFPRYAKIEIGFMDGKCLESRVNYPKGSPMNPYSSDELEQKLVTALQNQELSMAFIRDIRQFFHPINLVNFIQTYSEKI